MKTLNLSILTPDAEIFSGEVTSVTVPGTMGQFQVLYNHAPIISTLETGKIKVVTESGETLYNAEGGVVEVLKNKIIILAERINKLEAN